MAKSPKHTATDLAILRHQMDSNIPARPAPKERLTIHDVRSFNAGSTDAGMRLRWLSQTGEIIDMTLNPVIANAIALCIMQFGMEAGWLEENGTISGRPRPM